MNNQVALARPEWNHEDYFREKFKDVTILICQRKTRDLIQLCVTSILNHYPEINILVADGHSEDESVEWLRFMSAKHPNIKLWERPEGRNSHGETMHEAITQFITTKYVLLMDSDTIVRRGGFIEDILDRFKMNLHELFKDDSIMQNELKTSPLYAVGSLMLQSIKGEACSPPIDESDELRYAHPSCSMYDVEIYKTLHPFTDHGAPCSLNNIDSQKKGYRIEYFPVDKYVQHLCGASWQEVPTVWNDDGDVQIRQILSFINNYFEPKKKFKISTYDRGRLDFENSTFDNRFNVVAYYICEVSNHFEVESDFTKKVRLYATENPAAVEFEIYGIKVYERKYWQKYVSTK